jgi:hypothetical protein
MNLDSMPSELVELENRLLARRGVEPPAGLRDRVLRAVAESALPKRGDGWYRAALAAAVLVAINLSMIWASQTEYLVRPSPSANQISAELHALRLIESQQGGTFK